MTDELTTLTDDERIRRSRYWTYNMFHLANELNQNYPSSIMRRDFEKGILNALFREYPDEIVNIGESLHHIRINAIMAHISSNTTNIGCEQS